VPPAPPAANRNINITEEQQQQQHQKPKTTTATTTITKGNIVGTPSSHANDNVVGLSGGLPPVVLLQPMQGPGATA
jgi:hypothetical protein